MIQTGGRLIPIPSSYTMHSALGKLGWEERWFFFICKRYSSMVLLITHSILIPFFAFLASFSRAGSQFRHTIKRLTSKCFAVYRLYVVCVTGCLLFFPSEKLNLRAFQDFARGPQLVWTWTETWIFCTARRMRTSRTADLYPKPHKVATEGPNQPTKANDQLRKYLQRRDGIVVLTKQGWGNSQATVRIIMKRN